MIKKAAFTILFSILIIGNGWAQKSTTETTSPKIKWITFKEAIELNKKGDKRKIITDVFTSWCGWCKRMDASTFAEKEIVEYITKHFWAVKLDAEMSDTLVIDGITYVNKHPNANRSTHDLALKLLQNQMSYPSYAFLNEENQMITIVPGYYNSEAFMLVLRYIAENIYLSKPFTQFKAENTPIIKP
jgi:thioredoxin-related protein